ncbi:MAG: UbiA-like polyprenyltransferase [Terriglobia bacterium]
MFFFNPLKTTLEMIKFEHTLFALPFALLSAILAANGLPPFPKLGWIVMAMVGARSAAMTFNRIADWKIDAANPRTRNRALPAGLLSRAFAIAFTVAMSLLFMLAASRLNRLCFWLSVPVLLILFFYSYTKRFTNYSHLVLGFCLGMAPMGAWIAIRGEISLTPLLLCLIVTLWTAGFDIIYACQDTEFDRGRNLYSVPKRFGVKAALSISTGLHAFMLLLLLFLLHLEALGWISLLGIGIVAALLVYEHRLVRPDDLSRVNAAFFTVNGYISLLLLVALGIDKLL